MKEQQTGKRKEAIANIKIISGEGRIIINGKKYEEYIQNNPRLIKIIKSPLQLLNLEKNYDIIVRCIGGGLSGQADAIKLGISKALYKIVENNGQQELKRNGFLTRNSLCKERRKYGLKKARKAPQFSKR